MRRSVALLVPLFAFALGCPKDRKADRQDTAIPIDTMPADLSKLETALPPAAPDTFRPKRPSGPTTTASGGSVSVPSAPAALMDAVNREQAFTRFCYQEKGQKADPTLRGNVAMIVTIGSSGVTGARVGDSNWTSAAGRAVNQCLNERAGQAWRITPGAVSPGSYAVQLSFTG